jgi:50S ribosomal protein L16 3-hydroxylase
MNYRELQLDKEAFLARYWQREHLLIPDAVPEFHPALTADEVAGLALEEDVESRIVECIEGQWQQYHGPFNEGDFRRDSPWTLLVQAVDYHVPEVAGLLDLVDFIPRWRVDDIMVSYAVDGGSVGPHYDNYDVFLLQGEGERHWQVGPYCDSTAPLLPHPELRLLAEFRPEAEYTLGAGDILYVPPGISHWGIARGECTTFSIGFRAPRINDMVSRWVDHVLEQLDPEQFYRDFRIPPASRPGEIRPADLQRAQAQLLGALDQVAGDHWFGELVTEPRNGHPPDAQEALSSRQKLQIGPSLIELCPGAKLAWQQEAGVIVVFANGESGSFPDAVLPGLIELCGTSRLAGMALAGLLGAEGAVGLLDHLLQCGCIYVE